MKSIEYFIVPRFRRGRPIIPDQIPKLGSSLIRAIFFSDEYTTRNCIRNMQQDEVHVEMNEKRNNYGYIMYTSQYIQTMSSST